MNKNTDIMSGKNPTRFPYASATALTLFAAGLLAGCGGEVINQQNRGVTGQAAVSPFDNASADEEVFSRQSNVFPLLTVDLPNSKNDQPKVSTVLDLLNNPSGQPVATPTAHPGFGTTTQPTIQVGPQPANAPVSPLIVAATAPDAGPVKVALQAKPGDQFVLAVGEEGQLDLRVTSSSGIGSVTLEKSGDSWPTAIHVHFTYAQGKPFKSVEGFTASELPAEGQPLPLKTTSDQRTASATVIIPGFARSNRILIEWIDAYR